MPGYWLDTNTAKKCSLSCATCADGTTCATCPTGLKIGGDKRTGKTGLCAKIKPDAGFFADGDVAEGQTKCD